MKKILLIALAIFVLSASFAACQSANENAGTTDIISREMAMIASAGSQQIDPASVTFTSVMLSNSAAKEYEVEFIYNGIKYMVDIDALTGDVKRIEKEDVTDNSADDKNDIGRDAAIKAALAKAGLADVATADLSMLFVKLDEEHGRIAYEVEFVYGGFEYEVTVSAENGSILDYEKDEDKKELTSLPEFDSEGYISEEEAKNIALAHAKLTKAGIMGLRVMLERDDGRMVYEVEFYFVDSEYDYDIDAVTGEIISFDRDAEHISLGEASVDIKDIISEGDARSAAIAHAVVSEKDVYDFDIELDNDKGVLIYEIEFKCGDYEYEYDIAALDGSVIKYSKELDD